MATATRDYVRSSGYPSDIKFTECEEDGESVNPIQLNEALMPYRRTPTLPQTGLWLFQTMNYNT